MAKRKQFKAKYGLDAWRNLERRWTFRGSQVSVVIGVAHNMEIGDLDNLKDLVVDHFEGELVAVKDFIFTSKIVAYSAGPFALQILLGASVDGSTITTAANLDVEFNTLLGAAVSGKWDIIPLTTPIEAVCKGSNLWTVEPARLNLTRFMKSFFEAREAGEDDLNLNLIYYVSSNQSQTTDIYPRHEFWCHKTNEGNDLGLWDHGIGR